ncbi:MAG: hypothetical protein J6K62_04120 [Clostridia bacterium]|nr:hypothetical protein [Clostridia bacterium]
MTSVIMKQGIVIYRSKAMDPHPKSGRTILENRRCRCTAKRQKETHSGKFTVMIVAQNKQKVNTQTAFSEVSHKVMTVFV